MSARGFTLVELLVAGALSLGVVAAASALTAHARRAFLVEPAAIDVMHRARASADVLATAIGAPGGDQGLLDGAAPMSARVPAVRPLVALEGGVGSRFTAVQVWRAEPGAFARLAAAQPGTSGVLTLDLATPGACPQATGPAAFGPATSRSSPMSTAAPTPSRLPPPGSPVSCNPIGRSRSPSARAPGSSQPGSIDWGSPGNPMAPRSWSASRPLAP